MQSTKPLSFALLMLVSFPLSAQPSGPEFRRAGIVGGGSISTVFGNWNVIGQPPEMGHRGSWKHPTNGYMGDASFMVGVEFPIADYNGDTIPDTVHSVVVSPVARPQRAPYSQDPVTGRSWGFEPVSGFFSDPPNPSPAVSTQPATWPALWPDHPEWGSGVWNGLTGPNVFRGAVETYCVVDDAGDWNFNFAENNPRGIIFRPDSTNPLRTGQGLRVGVRYLLFSHPEFRDILLRVFTIKNESRHRYEKTVFGHLMGTFIGVTDVEQGSEYADDAAAYFASNDFILAWDFDHNASGNPRWHGPVGQMGEALLDAPGGGTIASCVQFSPSADISFGDDDELWSRLTPGRFQYPSWIINDTIVTAGSDADYLFGSHYFSMDSGQTRTIVSAVGYGWTKDAVLQNLLKAEALWHSGCDTLAVSSSVAITNFGVHRVLTGTTAVEYAVQPPGGTLEIWFSPDAGRRWKGIAKNVPATGTLLWNTTEVEDCAFGLLRLFLRDSTGSIQGFTTTPASFAVNNGANGAPGILILNDELGEDTTFTQGVYPLRLLLGDPEGHDLQVTGYYQTGPADTFHLFDSFAALPDTDVQIRSVSFSDLPNTNTLTLRFDASDGVNVVSDFTFTFRKQTSRGSVPPEHVQIISGHTDVSMEVRIVDSAQVQSHSYTISFEDTASSGRKLLNVYDNTIGSTLLNRVPFLSGIESPPFDGLAVYARDTATTIDPSLTHWNRNVGYQRFTSVTRFWVLMPNNDTYWGYCQPSNYRVVFHDTPVDTSVNVFNIIGYDVPSVPVPYRVVDAYTGSRIRVAAVSGDAITRLLFVENVLGLDRITWDVTISCNPPDSLPHGGDTLFVVTHKGLSYHDSVRVEGFTLLVPPPGTLPGAFALHQNFPNPFNPSTNIMYELQQPAAVTLVLYNVLGQRVATLVDERKPAGVHAVVFRNQGLASGVYVYRLTAGTQSASRKLLLLK